MARRFVRSASQYLETLSTPVTAAPLTLACWYNVDNVTTQHNLIGIYEPTGSTADLFCLTIEGTQANDPLHAYAAAAGTYNSSSINNVTAGSWQHAAGVFASSTSRTVYKDGVAGTTNTTARTPNAASLDRILIGRFQASSTIAYTDGLIAGAGIWNVALSADEIKLLANGYSPQNIRPQNLVFCPNLETQNALVLDAILNRHMTVYGAEYVPDIPPQVAARLPRRVARVYAFPSGGTVNSGAGSSAGTATASGVGASTASSSASSAGTATVSGVGASTAESVGTSAGTSTASAVGTDASAVVTQASQTAGWYFPRVKLSDWKERTAKERREYLERLLEAAESAPEDVREAVEEIIEPYQKADTEALAGNVRRLDVARINRLIARIERVIEDEDETLFLLMAS